MTERLYPSCDKCGKLICVAFGLRVGQEINVEDAPPFCPMKLHPGVIESTVGEYDHEDVRELARLSSLQEAECYELKADGLRAVKPRVEETVGFAQKMGYRRLGIGMCLGLKDEARIMSSILESKGFEVVCVGCKLGAVPKERIGLKPEEKIVGEELYEPMCNPIAQAEVLNAEGVDLAILMGMCVGHDTLFMKYCRAPMTVLSTKDRVTGHNPLAALYTTHTYYGHLRGSK